MHRIAVTTTLVIAASTLALAAQSAPAARPLPAANGVAVADGAIPAAPKAVARPAAAGPLLIPAQTPIQLQLETRLSTRTAGYGDGFAARVKTSVFYQGREVIPSGSIVEGHVLLVRDRRPVQGESQLLLQPDQLTTPSGRRYTISAEVIQTAGNGKTRVDSEGVLRAPRGLMTTDVHHAEIGAGAGVVGGALLAGGQGALWGGGVGAAVAAGLWLVRRRHLDLNPGSELTVRLERPLRLVRN